MRLFYEYDNLIEMTGMAPKSSNDDILFEYIDTPAKLSGLMEALQAPDPISLDTEADSFHHYQPKICLIQLTFEGRNYIVDPLAKTDLSAFLDLLSHKELIIHDAGYDLRLLYTDFGFKPGVEVFDTMLAASLAGLKNVGLSALLNQFFDKNPAKHHQKADWSKRPLPENLLRYAIEDTVYLFQIKQYLEAELNKLGRMEWYLETCRWAVRAVYTHKELPDPDRQWRIKGSGRCSPREMAFLKELWQWRDNIAHQTNIAPFMICRNEQILELVMWAAHRKKPIEPHTKLPIRCAGKFKEALMAALLKAQDLPEDQWPAKIKSDRSKRLPEKTLGVINQLKNECETVAAEYDLPPQLLASRSALTRIVVNNAATLEEIQKKEILMNWQANLLLPVIKKVLAQ
jgi:ribonuclease D